MPPARRSFSRDELDVFIGAEVPDLIGANLRLLFVGINPGLWTAATGLHFGHPGNRFWPALRLAGIIEREVQRGRPMADDDSAHVISRGIGITNLVARATAKASELTPAELRSGGERLVGLVESTRPAVIAVAGITAYRAAFARPRAVAGRQPEALGGAELWVVPNPSGLNAHETVHSLAAAYRMPAARANCLLETTDSDSSSRQFASRQFGGGA